MLESEAMVCGASATSSLIVNAFNPSLIVSAYRLNKASILDTKKSSLTGSLPKSGAFDWLRPLGITAVSG